ncbi:DNA translocase FtsK 4TM domain-containing protein, partial [Francisella tularensis]|uniref:DNA translocase FtsK 4TM domain-containing protein n=1 Tax=Francisella tularensis TaxID=263 RepID=UPI002381C21E
MTLVVILTASIIYVFIALFSFYFNDPWWCSVSSETSIKNYAGHGGGYVARCLV